MKKKKSCFTTPLNKKEIREIKKIMRLAAKFIRTEEGKKIIKKQIRKFKKCK